MFLAVARSFSDGDAMYYAFPFWWMTLMLSRSAWPYGEWRHRAAGSIALDKFPKYSPGRHAVFRLWSYNGSKLGTRATAAYEVFVQSCVITSATAWRRFCFYCRLFISRTSKTSWVNRHIIGESLEYDSTIRLNCELFGLGFANTGSVLLSNV